MIDRGAEEGAGSFSWNSLLWVGLGLGAAALVAGYDFEVFHHLVEMFGIGIACTIFAVAWNTRRYGEGPFLSLLALSFLAVALIDTLHLVIYARSSGPASLNLAQQLEQFRDLGSGFSLLLAGLWGYRRFSSPLLPAAYGLLLLALLASLLAGGIWPDFYRGAQELTDQGAMGQGIASLVLAVAALVCWRRRVALDPEVRPLLLGAALAGLVAEQLTLISLLRQDLRDLGGHLFWMLSFYLVYRALVQVGVARPHAMALRAIRLRQEQLEVEAALDAVLLEQTEGVLRESGMQHRQELRAAERRFRDLFDTVKLAGVLLDLEGRITYCNGYLLGLLGRTLDQVLGQDWCEVCVPLEHRTEVHQIFTEILFEGDQELYTHYESEIETATGQRLCIAWNNTLLRDEYNQVYSIASLGANTTAQRQAEGAQRQREEQYRIVADNTYDWEFWLSPEGRFRYCSPSCERLTGYPAAEFMAAPELLAEIVHPEDREAFALHRMAHCEVSEQEFRILRRDGEVRWISHVCQPVYDRTGEYLGTRGSNRDISARREAEEALVQSARLISLGEMAAGIAHELNQPLTVVATLAEGLQIRLEQGLEVPRQRYLQWSEETLGQVERMRRIIDHLRDFSRKRLALPSEVVDLNQVVVSALGMSQAQLKAHGIEVHQELDAALPSVLGDPYQLEQVLVNLTINARDALDQRERAFGGSVPPDWEKVLAVRTCRPPDQPDWVVVEVEDCGVGISEEDQRRLFQPFFTTKEPGVGTGLGLSISYTIIRDHRGRLECHSRLGEGAVFQLWLPVCG